MYQPKPLKIDGKTIGAGNPAYIVAEIGINHNGDIELAKAQIDAAKETGADAVKFQNYATEDFLSDKSLDYTYETYNEAGELEEITESQWDMFKRCEVGRDKLEIFADHCKKVGISIHSTPTNKQGIADLQAIGVDVLKNGSDYLPDLDVVRAMGETGLPTVLSTGMATITEIDEAVNAFRETGNDQLIVLHCTSAYPTPDDEVNVQRVKTIRDTWGCLSGFSDHSWGISAAVLSIVYGACWIEKHFTLDKKLRGPDHRFSADPEEFKALVTAVRAAEQQIGSPVIQPTKGEAYGREGFRLSCVASEDLKAGTVLTKEHLAYRRPGTGIRPALRDALIGRTLKADLPKGHLFETDKDFQ